MTKQTKDYITLKPIAERFKNVASSISDNEIRSLIKDELREQIRDQVGVGTEIGEIICDWFEEDKNREFVIKCLKESIEKKFK